MITQHPTKRYRADDGYDDACHFVECDFCRKAAPIGGNIEHTVERAKQAGFITVRGASLAAPRKWVCPGCPKYNKVSP